jgi:hypothetical protein
MHAEKEECIYEHFKSHFDEPQPRDVTLDWEAIGIEQHDLSHLEAIGMW